MTTPRNTSSDLRKTGEAYFTYIIGFCRLSKARTHLNPKPWNRMTRDLGPKQSPASPSCLIFPSRTKSSQTHVKWEHSKQNFRQNKKSALFFGNTWPEKVLWYCLPILRKIRLVKIPLKLKPHPTSQILGVHCPQAAQASPSSSAIIFLKIYYYSYKKGNKNRVGRCYSDEPIKPITSNFKEPVFISFFRGHFAPNKSRESYPLSVSGLGRVSEPLCQSVWVSFALKIGVQVREPEILVSEPLWLSVWVGFH